VGAEVEKLIRTQQQGALSATLYTVGLDGHRTVCLRWAGPFDDHAELLEQCEERALRQANALGGVHSFCFEMLDGSGASLGCEFFRVSAESFGGERSLLSEPANEGGVLAQSMRLTEAFARLQVMGAEKQSTITLRMLEASAKRAEFAEGKYLEAIQATHSMLTGERAAEVEMVKANNRGQAQLVIANRVATLIGPVMAAFLSKKGGEQGGLHAAMVGLTGLISSLTAEQLEAIVGHLKPEQAAAMFQLVGTVTTEAEKQKAADTPAPRKGANGDARH